MDQQSPGLLLDRRARDPLALQVVNEARHIVRHEVEFVAVIFMRRMDRDFRWRQAENQPALSCVCGGKVQHVPQKRPIGFRILAVNN